MDRLEQFIKPLTGFGADEKDGRIGHEAEGFFQFLAHPVHGIAVLFDGVPLVDRNDAGFPLFVCVTGHFGILFGKADGGVDHDHAHPAALHRGQAAQNAEPLDPAFHLALFAQAGGVGKDELAVLVLHLGVDGIPGGAGLIGHNQAVFSKDTVDQAGFAHIGTADHRHRDAVILLLVFLFKLQVGAYGIQQVAGAVPVYAGHRDQFPSPRA